MRKALIAGAILATLILATQSAGAAPKLVSFSGGDAEVTINGDGSVTIDMVPFAPYEDYGGVYLKSRSNSGKLLGNVDFSFRSTGDVTGGAPRFSIPVDDPATGSSLDGYLFLDVANCGGVAGTPTTVSTNNSACAVFLNVGGSWSNWDALVADHPTWRVAPGRVPFIVADWGPGVYEISNIDLR